jgi:hypothetical protein
METKKVDVKEMYRKLYKKLSEHTGNVIQYIDLYSIAKKSGVKITKLFRGKDHITDKALGKYEIWIDIPGWGNSRAGKGNTLGEAVKDAISWCSIMNGIYQKS